MTDKIIPYYVRGHTAEGIVNYIESNLKGIKQVIILRHDNKQFIADVLRFFEEQWEDKSTIETIYSPYLTKQLEGIIDRKHALAVLAEGILSNETRALKEIDLNEWLPVQVDNDIKKAGNQLLQEAYRLIKEALVIHDKLERVFINEMNFAKADKVAEKLLKEMFDQVPTKNKQGQVVERLFGTNTIDGAVNEVEQIIKPINHRVFIKGRAGTGKSVLLKKVLNKSLEKGYDVELYHCSFDPQSIDMVLIRELNYCLFDSTAPHEFFPTRATDQVIDLYETTVTSGTDEKYAKEIIQITNAYKEKLKKGLENINALHEIDSFKPVRLDNDKYHRIIDKVYNDIDQVIS